MEKKYLTVKEVADKAGVSYQAVYKRLNTTLKKYVVLVEGRKLLRSEVLSEFGHSRKSTVEEEIEPSSKQNKPSSSFNEEEYKRLNARNEQMIDELRAQIQEKDEQIKKQSDHIIDLSNKIAELFDNNQKLQLNYQLLLSEGDKDKDIIEVDPDSAPGDEEDQDKKIDQDDKEKDERKGFFQRLFGF